jgi:acetyltransferase-like isoleucine patch superfamily enzyme
MKALLICPGERAEVAALSESVPLANLNILGKAVIEYWLEHLAVKGAKEVYVLATDRPDRVRALVGNGARWGLRVEVLPEFRELTVTAARAKYRGNNSPHWLPAPLDVNLMDSLPDLPGIPLFKSYADWAAVHRVSLPRAATPDRIGLREIQPGIWVGLHAHISRDAQILAPCWIGEDAVISAGATVGPMAIVEKQAVIERGAEVTHSIIGPQTLVGELTDVRNSIALGSTLINWKLNSSIKIPERYLLCSLARPQFTLRPVSAVSRVVAAIVMLFTLPFALYPIVRQLLRGRPVFRSQMAVRPRPTNNTGLPGELIVYHEFANTRGWLRRWPQLWKIIRGQFAWVGNRPLSPRQAVALTNEFERLWLTTRVGLLSLADTQGVPDALNSEARAHASYYAVRASRFLDAKIFAGAMFVFAFGLPWSRVRDALGRLVGNVMGDERKAM